jgi:hypothetical protein
MGDGTVTPPSLEHMSDRSASREVEQDGRW